MKPIKIAIYSGTIPSTTFIERLIEGLADQGFNVVLFGRQRQRVRYESPNIKIVGNRTGIVGLVQTAARIIRLRYSAPIQYKKLKQHLGFGPFAGISAFRNWEIYVPVLLQLPDIFHVQWAKAANDWVFLKEQFGVKLVLSLRGTHITNSPLDDIALATAYRNSFPRYDAFHSVSKSILEIAIQYGAKKEKAHTIYSGLKVAPGNTTVLKQNHKLQLLVVGRFNWIKGYHHLMDALFILKNRNIQFNLTLIAQGDMPEEIMFKLHDFKIKEEVLWINGLPHKEVLRHMLNHDVLILPSIQEGVANVVLEAMNVGLPVISTDCGGMGEVIENGVNGFLVPVRNPNAMANAIVKFSNLSTHQIELMRTQAHCTIQNRFDMDVNIKMFARMYNEILSCESV